MHPTNCSSVKKRQVVLQKWGIPKILRQLNLAVVTNHEPQSFRAFGGDF